jgi:hypothetical protein
VSLDETCRELERYEAVAEKAAKRIQDLKEQLVAELTRRGERTVVTEEGRRVTVVHGERRVWDQAALRELLAQRGLWDRCRVVTETADLEQLELLIEEGEVAERDLADALDVRPNRPYPRVSPPKPRRKR